MHVPQRPHKMPLHSLSRTLEASTLPLAVSELKSFLEIDADDNTQDDKLIVMLRAAVESCERFTRRTFVNTTWTMWMDRFPGEPLPWWDGVRQIADTELTNLVMPIVLPRPPLRTVTHVKAHSDSGETTAASSTYYVDVASEPGRIVLNTTASWPTTPLRRANGVEVEYVAGYGSNGQDVPAPIRQALLVCVGAMNAAGASGDSLKFEKVGDSSLSRFGPDETGSSIPQQAKNLLSTYKVWMV